MVIENKCRKRHIHLFLRCLHFHMLKISATLRQNIFALCHSKQHSTQAHILTHKHTNHQMEMELEVGIKMWLSKYRSGKEVGQKGYQAILICTLCSEYGLQHRNTNINTKLPLQTQAKTSSSSPKASSSKRNHKLKHTYKLLNYGVHNFRHHNHIYVDNLMSFTLRRSFSISIPYNQL